MEAIVEVRELRKRFGDVVALDGMSFTVRPGRVTGFVGPNGAGKSTTIRAVLGLEALDSGEALIGGRPYRSLRGPLRQVGALLDADAPEPGRTARNHLLWLARTHGMGARRVDEVLGLVGLEEVARRPVGTLSLGMRQRLGIAGALLGDPPVLLLDEPFSGLEPEGIVWMRELLVSLAGQGRTILVASHLMSELDDTAEQLVVAGRGRVVADVSVRDLLGRASRGRVALDTAARTEATALLARAGATVVSTGSGKLTVAGLPAERITQLLEGGGVPFSQISPHRATLEEAYMELTRDATEFSSAMDGQGQAGHLGDPARGEAGEERRRLAGVVDEEASSR
ncbi:ATP-binding cassette domain-containing protein [Micromonospora sp. CPCC 205371]|nr:ATP-binding cassette domain-containing protein [Micromonospora sp. CPCC 205371]